MFIVFSVAEITLRFPGNVFQGQIAGSLAENLLFPLGDIPGYCPVRAAKTLFVFIRQPLINPPGCMSLLALGLFVLSQPGIDIRFERVQLGKLNPCQRPGLDLIPVLFF